MNNNWCLIVLQNVIIKSNSFKYICRGAFFRGAYNGSIFLFTGGWAYNWWGGGGGVLISRSLRYVIGLDLRFEITVNGK